MLHEHALTYKDRLSIADLDYLVKKANKLGRLGRDVIHVNQEDDLDGTHIYYFVTGLSGEQKRYEEDIRTER